MRKKWEFYDAEEEKIKKIEKSYLKTVITISLK